MINVCFLLSAKEVDSKWVRGRGGGRERERERGGEGEGEEKENDCFKLRAKCISFLIASM